MSERIKNSENGGADLRHAPEDAPEVLVKNKKKKESGKKAAPEKKEKAPKRPRPPKTKKEKKGRKEKKPASAGRGALITLLIMLVLLGGVAALVILDAGGAKGMVSDALGLTAAADEAYQARMDEWQTALQNEAEELKSRTADVQRRESDVVARENTLVQKESDLENKIAEYEELVAQLQAKNADINDVVKMLSGMSADSAAPVLLAMSDRETMISIFKQLKTATQSALLEVMSAEDAAAIIEGMK